MNTMPHEQGQSLKLFLGSIGGLTNVRYDHIPEQMWVGAFTSVLIARSSNDLIDGIVSQRVACPRLHKELVTNRT
jgi:hypothetical protein